MCAQAGDLVINYDVREDIEEVASRTSEPRVVRALESVRTCEEAISRNVSPETCLDALLFEIGEALYGTHSPR